jgi:hypothetical protein
LPLGADSVAPLPVLPKVVLTGQTMRIWSVPADTLRSSRELSK